MTRTDAGARAAAALAAAVHGIIPLNSHWVFGSLPMFDVYAIGSLVVAVAISSALAIVIRSRNAPRARWVCIAVLLTAAAFQSVMAVLGVPDPYARSPNAGMLISLGSWVRTELPTDDFVLRAVACVIAAILMGFARPRITPFATPVESHDSDTTGCRGSR